MARARTLQAHGTYMEGVMTQRSDSANDRGVATLRFMSALRDGDISLARQLIEQPLDVNFTEADGVSLLMIAAYRGYADICERLIDLGADVQHGFFVHYPVPDDIDETEYDSVVERALISRDAKTIDVIERAFTRAQWASVKAATKHDKSDLFLFGTARLVDAARLGMVELVTDMVTAGVPIEEPRYYREMSPLIAAAEHQQFATCAVLVALGANPADLRGHRNISGELQHALEIVARHLFGENALDRPAEWQDRVWSGAPPEVS